MNKAAKRLRILAVFTFLLSPLFAWGSVIASDETAVFASLSRMIWFSGSSIRIFIAMLVLFVPMLIAFFLAHGMCGISKTQTLILRICMIVSCAVLYVGAMWIMPSDGNTMTRENVWHGILSFGGMLMIFLTYCLYTAFICRIERLVTFCGKKVHEIANIRSFKKLFLMVRTLCFFFIPVKFTV